MHVSCHAPSLKSHGFSNIFISAMLMFTFDRSQRIASIGTDWVFGGLHNDFVACVPDNSCLCIATTRRVITSSLKLNYSSAERGALFEALFEPLNNQLHWHWPNYQLATLFIIRRSKINARINQAMLRALTGHSFSLSTVASRSCKLLN